jgi:TolB-like protein/predicted Zn-dependent protease
MQWLLRAAQARNLDRIAVAYAVAGWILVQGASIVLPAFDAPIWTLRAFIVAVVMGFPATLGIAWFAVSPAVVAHAPAGLVSHRELVLLALLGVVLLLSVSEALFLRVPVPAVPAPRHATPIEASIAVLPFVNMSGDAHKEYFSDGISEELLNDLSNVPGLRVAARTSSFAFKNRTVDIKTIAHLLGVRAVLEGSVRESVNRIRITAQLINATDGFHLWSSVYDRNLTDILVVQDDIARAITTTLQARLVPVANGTPIRIDPQDYRDYLAAKHFNALKTRGGITRAVALLEKVTSREPGFADAFAALASAYLDVDWIVSDEAAFREKAAAASATALRLDPGNAFALYLRSRMHDDDSNWRAAADDLRRLKAASPNSSIMAKALSSYYNDLGFFPEAAAEAKKGAELDPLSNNAQVWLGYLLARAGETDAAIAAWKAALALQPWQDIALYGLCDGYAYAHRLPEARAIAEDLRRMAPIDDLRECQAEIDIAAEDFASARKNIDAMASEASRGQLGAAEKALAYIQIGDYDTALKWSRRAYAAKEVVDLASLPYDATLPKPFFDTAGWKALATKPELRAWRAEHDRIAAQHPK